MASERTPAPYPTHGPGGEYGDESWSAYFRRVKRQRLDDGELDKPSDILIRASGEWESTDAHLRPRSLIAFDKLLKANGFTVFEGLYRTTFEEGGVYGPTAQKAGERKPDRLMTTILYAAGKQGYGYCKLTFEQANEGSWTCTWRQINGEHREVSDAELKEWINDDTVER